MKYKYTILILVMIMLGVTSVSAIGNPGAGYFVIHNANEHHSDYHPQTGGFEPSWLKELPMFAVVNMVMVALSIVGLVFAREIPILFLIVLVIWVILLVTYDIPQVQKFTNTTQTMCEMKANGNSSLSC